MSNLVPSLKSLPAPQHEWRVRRHLQGFSPYDERRRGRFRVTTSQQPRNENHRSGAVSVPRRASETLRQRRQGSGRNWRQDSESSSTGTRLAWQQPDLHQKGRHNVRREPDVERGQPEARSKARGDGHQKEEGIEGRQSSERIRKRTACRAAPGMPGGIHHTN